MERLFTPWRYDYITKSPASPESREAAGCFFCAASRKPGDSDGLVVHAGRHHLVMLNLHPYSNGHLMVAPFEHHASPQESGPEAQAEFWPLVLECQRVLQKAYSPDGFNLGLNLGKAAGAGVPGHFHFHLVPRWTGDTNFMTVLAEVRLVPEDLRQSCERLRALFARAAPEEETRLGSTR
jgi:ATP adenylyltransferase